MLDFLSYAVIFLLLGAFVYALIYAFIYEPIKEIINEVKLNKEFKKIKNFGNDNANFFKN